MPTKIKANRKLLIEALEAELAKSEAEFKAREAAYKLKEAAYAGQTADALEKAAALIRKGKGVKGTWGKYNVNLPDPPAKTTKGTCELEQMIKGLKLSTEEAIIINDDSRYLRFVCGKR